MSVTAAGAEIRDVTFARCGSGISTGLALQMKADGILVSNCVFTLCGNDLAASGNNNGRFVVTKDYNPVASGTISGCVFTNNAPPTSSAVYVGGSTVVENCLFAGNESRGGFGHANYRGLAVWAKGNAVVRNCTVADNRKDVDDDDAALWVESDGVTVENNVVWHNVVGATSPEARNWHHSSSSFAKWRNNCTTGADGLNAGGGADNIGSDPLFAEDGVHLLFSSPCRGAANANAPAVDLDGRARPSPASIGCLEPVVSQTLSVALAASAAAGTPSAPVVVTATPDGAFDAPLSFAFTVAVDGVGTTEETNASGTLSLSAVGAYAVSVEVSDAAGRTASAALPDEIVIYDPAGVVHVDAAAAAPAKPYMSRATATTNLLDAVGVCPEGGRVVVHPGLYVFGPSETKIPLVRAIDVAGAASEGGEAVLAYGYFEVRAAGASVRNLVFDQAAKRGRMDKEAVQMSAAGVVSNCVFRNATDRNSYPRGQINASAGLVTGCIVSNCLSRRIAGIEATGTAVVENCLVAGCRSGDNPYDLNAQASRGAAFNVGGRAVLRNCTAVSNAVAYANQNASLQDGWASPALHAQPGFAGQVVNCVFAGNARRFEADGAYVATNDVAIGAALVSHCAVEGPLCDYAGYAGMVTNGIAFADGAPVPVPAPGSSLVDAGLANVALASSVDLLGNRRRASRIDIGCTEAEKPRGTVVIVK